MKTINNSILTFFLLFAAVIVTTNVVWAANSSFVFPTDKATVSNNQIRVICTSSKKSANLLLIVKNSTGEQKSPLSDHGGAFSSLIDLAPGLNTLTLTDKSTPIASIEVSQVQPFPANITDLNPFYIHSQGDTTEKCEDCHLLEATGKAKFKYIEQKVQCITAKCHPGFSDAKSLHGPFDSGSCIECHNLHGSNNKFFLQKPGAHLCYTCHTEAEGMLQEGSVVHFPVAKGNCIDCHDAHKSNQEYHLKRDTMAEMCAGCHVNRITEHQVMHEPVESGDCNACHSPHTSENKNLLSDKMNDLCFSCHEVREEEFKSRFIHEPVKKDCNLCHDPHGSAADFHIITKKDSNGAYNETDFPVSELCISCHRKLDPTIIDQIENSSVPHKPVQEGNCTVCHTPHSTNYKKQLNAPLASICYSCHKKIKAAIEGSKYKHGPIHNNDCAQCHLVHGANSDHLLTAKFSNKFSGKFKIANFALCFNCHNKNVVTEKKSKTTGFRNGIVNLHYMHVNKKKRGRNCKTCHDIHASDQPKHIRKKIPYKKKFLKIEFSMTKTGGSCISSCHKEKRYDRETKIKNK